VEEAVVVALGLVGVVGIVSDGLAEVGAVLDGVAVVIHRLDRVVAEDIRLGKAGIFDVIIVPVTRLDVPLNIETGKVVLGAGGIKRERHHFGLARVVLHERCRFLHRRSGRKPSGKRHGGDGDGAQSTPSSHGCTVAVVEAFAAVVLAGGNTLQFSNRQRVATSNN